MEQPPAPAPSGPTVPKLSTTVLLAMGAIATIVLVAIFAYILFVAPALRIDERLWWTGLTSMVFALGFYMMYAATHDRTIARPLAGGFFVVGGSFYGSIFTGGSNDFAKLMYLILLSILVMIVLGAIFVMARDAEKDAIRRAQRKYIP